MSKETRIDLRQLNLEIAEKIMGWKRSFASAQSNGRFDKWIDGEGFTRLSYYPDDPPRTDFCEWFKPSSDIAAAMLVVETLRAEFGLRVSINQTADMYQVSISKPAPYQNLVTVFEPSLPLAISLAALKVAEGER